MQYSPPVNTGADVKAAVCREFGAPLSVEDVSLIDPGANEVKVAIRASAICHSDIAFMDGAWGGALRRSTVTKHPAS